MVGGGIRRLDARLAFLLLAAFVYGLMGVPTPDNLGVVEGIIGLCLVLAVGASGAWQALRYQKADAFWVNAGRILLVFGVSVPFAVGLMSGAGLMAILRDVLPFLFMMLPVFMVGVLRRNAGGLSLLVMALVFVGFCFSVRSLMGSDPLHYLVNMPSVLMAGLFCGGTALTVFIARFSLRGLAIAACLAACAAVIMWPVLLTQQRASTGAFAFVMLLISGRLLWRYPRRMLALALPILIAGLYIFFASGALDDMARKSDLVGFNMRFEELAAVWAQIAEQPLSLLFGKGWGGHFQSPAVADIRVNYTHSLLSSVLLKMGVSGLALVGLYLYGLVRVWWRVALAYPVLALAIICPILIDVFLYASFKSLDFGLVLLALVALSYFHDAKIEGKNPQAIAS